MLPELRLFVVCWHPAAAPTPHDFRMRDIRTMLFPPPGATFPMVYTEVYFYALMTGVRRPHQFAIRSRHGVGPQSAIVWEGEPSTLSMGTNPLTVHSLPFREKAVLFPRPGQYEFILLCDGAELSPPFYLEMGV